MMQEVKWNERFNIGVGIVDKAHQRLFSIVHRLMNFSEDEKRSQWACAEGIKYFKSYAVKHFAEEEEYMRTIDYNGYAMHKRLHDNMRDKVLPALEKDLEDSGYSEESIHHFLGICLGWLTGHIMIEDRAITGRTANKWKEEQTGTEIETLEKTISHVTNEVFKLETKIVSEHYAGEDFGDAIIYRITYRSGEKEQWQIFFVLEEQLVLATVGEMLGVKFQRVDKMVIDATRQISQQLLKCLGMYFQVTGQYKFEKDHLLTRDQLLQEFNSAYPYYSLLFDTGIGYFAFCAKKRIIR